MTAVTTYLCVEGAADALDFYRRAFGAEELYRLTMDNGAIGHAEMRIGETTLMISDEWPEGGVVSPLRQEGSSTSLALTVDSVDALDALWGQALAAGASVEREIEDQFYGHRTGTVVDPFGHRWSIAAVVEEVSPEEMQRRMAGMGP
ncbi:MAG: VOC family protein [Actinobacteria bacterium]|nr:VOC family protein [Actinomycetota bacterium]